VIARGDGILFPKNILPRIKICGKEFFSLMLLCPIMLGSSND